MEETQSLDLSSVLVSVATSVVEANRILNEGTETPMGITEFKIEYKLHASLYVKELAPVGRGIGIAEAGVPMLQKARVAPAQLRQLTVLTPKERILTGYLREADLTITAKIEPLPKVK